MTQTFFRRVSAMAISLCLLEAAQGQMKYIIKGEVGKENNGKMVILHSYMGQLNDSAVIGNGKFRFEGKIKQPYESYISISEPRKTPLKVGDVVPMEDGQQFYLSDGVTTINGKNLASASIDNPVQHDLLVLKALKKPLEDRMNALSGLIYF